MLIAMAGIALTTLAALTAYDGYVKRRPDGIAVALFLAIVAGACIERAVLGV